MMEFEKAFARLEKILQLMNGNEVSLDQSLKLYEEADQLIGTCQKRLTDAEKRIETLIKDREGQLEVDDEGTPKVEAFS